jgi:hypothetical protein
LLLLSFCSVLLFPVLLVYADAWVSPTGYQDPSSGWNNEANAYDEATGTRADSNGFLKQTWSTYLVLNYTSTRGNKIQCYVEKSSSYMTTMEIDVANQTGSWVNVFSATPTYAAWYNVTFASKHTSTAMRFRFWNSASSTWTCYAYVNEADYLNFPDDSVPSYDLSKCGTNTTLSVSTWLFYSYWYSTVTLLSGFIFSFNQSGSYVNDTWVSFPATNSTWANVSKSITLNCGSVVGWLVYANTSAGWTVLPVQYETVSALVTFYFTDLGSLERNGSVLGNGTSTTYSSLSPVLHLTGVPESNMTCVNFTIGGVLVSGNPYNFTVQNSTSVWCYFANYTSSGGGVPWIMAGFTWTVPNPVAGEWFFFNASYSDSSGVIANYTWDFGTGNGWETEVMGLVYHYYASNGVYNVSLFVGGDVGNSSVLTLVVVVGTYSSGYSAGYSAGYAAGWSAGNSTGYVAGWIIGNDTGYVAGYAAGYAVGYADGSAAGSDDFNFVYAGGFAGIIGVGGVVVLWSARRRKRKFR